MGLKKSEVVGIPIATIPADIPLACDLYLIVNKKLTAFRKQGDTVSDERLDRLEAFQVREFFVPEDQEELLKRMLKHFLLGARHDSLRALKVLKQAGYLFTKDVLTQRELEYPLAQATVYLQALYERIEREPKVLRELYLLCRHNSYACNHALETAMLSIGLGVAAELEAAHTEQIGLGGLIHDIGERGVDWSLLAKNAPLSQSEKNQIQKHPHIGLDYVRDFQLPELVLDAIRDHHENFDGTGYPNHKAGDEISLAGKLVAIADVFSALTHDRPYRKALSADKAVQYMQSLEPGRFDPDLLRLFIQKVAPL